MCTQVPYIPRTVLTGTCMGKRQMHPLAQTCTCRHRGTSMQKDYGDTEKETPRHTERLHRRTQRQQKQVHWERATCTEPKVDTFAQPHWQMQMYRWSYMYRYSHPERDTQELTWSHTHTITQAFPNADNQICTHRNVIMFNTCSWEESAHRLHKFITNFTDIKDA